MHGGSRILIVGLLLAGAACARGSGGAEPTPSAARVNVTNHWELPMEVYVTGAGINHRLGLVAPGVERSFVLPHALIGSGGRLEFVAQPSGGGLVARSGEITVWPGDIVDFEITTHLFDSRATVRP